MELILLKPNCKFLPDEWLQSAHMPSLLDKQDKSKEPGLPASGQNGSESGTTKNEGAEVGSVCPN